MAATFKEATDEILALFKAAWDPTQLPAVYENVGDDIPTTRTAWARPVLRFGLGGQASLSNGTGQTRFERNGILTVQIFIPNGDGLDLGWSLGKIVADAYEGVATASHVWFREGQLLPIGPDGKWFQFNFMTLFTFDEVK